MISATNDIRKTFGASQCWLSRLARIKIK